MPRDKAAPARKRPIEEVEHHAEQASASLDAAELIERAERAGVRERIGTGACRQLLLDDSTDVPNGLARFFINEEDYVAFSELHALITSKLSNELTGWGGIGDKTGRLRGYGYFSPATASSSSLASTHYECSHVMKEYTGQQAEADRAANRRASVWLDETSLPARLHEALRNLTDALRPLLPERYRRFAVPEALVAAQPNLHNGRAYLRPHLDEPLNDGFGIVIVTLAIRGSAKILLRRGGTSTEELSEEACFDLHATQRQGYALSGEVRNAWLHGVLAEDGSEARESLNLRFGLHAAGADEDFSAAHEVERHWT